MNLGITQTSVMNAASKSVNFITVRPSIGFMVAMAWLLKDDRSLESETRFVKVVFASGVARYCARNLHRASSFPRFHPNSFAV